MPSKKLSNKYSYCLARRICMISEKSDEKHVKLNELKTILSKQGYPLRIIKTGIENANKMD